VKNALNPAGSGGKGRFRAFQEAQERLGADFGGKWRTPAIPTATPPAIFNPPPFSHGLKDFRSKTSPLSFKGFPVA
jgi:hypothetical protein